MFCDVRREIDGSVFENFAVVLDGRGSDSKPPSKNGVSCRVQEFLGGVSKVFGLRRKRKFKNEVFQTGFFGKNRCSTVFDSKGLKKKTRF